jgi:hypothetical protein
MLAMLVVCAAVVVCSVLILPSFVVSRPSADVRRVFCVLLTVSCAVIAVSAVVMREPKEVSESSCCAFFVWILVIAMLFVVISLVCVASCMEMDDVVSKLLRLVVVRLLRPEQETTPVEERLLQETLPFVERFPPTDALLLTDKLEHVVKLGFDILLK